MAIGEATLVFHYIFVILNSFQGVFFFVFFCLLNKEVGFYSNKNDEYDHDDDYYYAVSEH